MSAKKNAFEVLRDLAWLPEVPDNFSSEVRGVRSLEGLVPFTSYGLNLNQLISLANKLNGFLKEGNEFSTREKYRVGLISNSTTKLLPAPLIATALRYGIYLNVVEAEFDQVAQTALGQESLFYENKLHYVLLAVDYRGLPLHESIGDLESANGTVKACLNYLLINAKLINEKTGALVILQNIVPPAQSIFGSLESNLVGTNQWIINQINVELSRSTLSNIAILDVAGLASMIGLANWHNAALWYSAKIPFELNLIPIYSEWIARIIAATQGKSRRGLILDLDNTLWGGVIGDDGIEGIKIGQGDSVGEAHLGIQKLALRLRDRGVVLAVSSKNTDEIAREPFKNHPDMILRENHIAVFQANWSDKASNIKHIAKSLNLGLQSFVFLDDNPAERMQVRKELPEVAVPELPDDPSYFVDYLIAGGYFEAILFSSEDRLRADLYQKNQELGKMLEQAKDMGEYLLALRMEIDLSPFNLTGRARIAQLISKSNQFNLTTRRYSEVDIEAFERSSEIYARQIRLTDKFGDNGMISVVICRKLGSQWEIDTWLMSCRVLGRRVEEFVLQNIIQAARAEGVEKLIGHYRPTSKNGIVKDHYLKLGFSLDSSDESGETWIMDLSGYQDKSLPFSVKHVI